MSGGSDKLSLKEDDVTKMLAATTHIGSTNTDFQMEQYVYKRRSDGEACFSNSPFCDTLIVAHLFQVSTSSTCAGPTRSCSWLPGPL